MARPDFTTEYLFNWYPDLERAALVLSTICASSNLYQDLGYNDAQVADAKASMVSLNPLGKIFPSKEAYICLGDNFFCDEKGCDDFVYALIGELRDEKGIAGFSLHALKDFDKYFKYRGDDEEEAARKANGIEGIFGRGNSDILQLLLIKNDRNPEDIESLLKLGFTTPVVDRFEIDWMIRNNLEGVVHSTRQQQRIRGSWLDEDHSSFMVVTGMSDILVDKDISVAALWQRLPEVSDGLYNYSLFGRHLVTEEQKKFIYEHA